MLKLQNKKYQLVACKHVLRMGDRHFEKKLLTTYYNYTSANHLQNVESFIEKQLD